MAVTILIADDHDIIREGIKSILKPHPEYRIIGEAKDGEEARNLTAKLKPEILLLDITLPRVSGLDIIQQIHRESAATKIIIITVHKMGAYVLRALQLGIKGYLNKDNVVEELVAALALVCKGGVYLGVQTSQYLTQIAGPKPEQDIRGLTKRELDILRLTVEGKTAKEIAETVFLSRRTVENYKNNILKKLNLRKTSDLIKYSVENKIVDLDTEA